MEPLKPKPIPVLATAVIMLLIAFAAPRLHAVPTITIDDLTDTISVTGDGFSTLPVIGQLFATGQIPGLAEGVFFVGVGGNVGNGGTKAGLWLDPGSQSSDVFLVRSISTTLHLADLTVGIFLSDPSAVPPNPLRIPAIPGILPNGLDLDLSPLLNLVGVNEPDGFQNISPVDGIVVKARSDVVETPDGGATLVTLGLVLAILAGVRRVQEGSFFTR